MMKVNKPYVFEGLFMFNVVKYKGYYKKVKDGVYLEIDKEKQVADWVNLRQHEVNYDTWEVINDGIVEHDTDRAVKTYYEYKESKGIGIIVGFVDLVVEGEIEVTWEDYPDYPMRIDKNPTKTVPCAVVYYANMKKHYVPIDSITDVADIDISTMNWRERKGVWDEI